MNRSLHITIVEGGTGPQQRGSASPTTTLKSDPESNYVMPPPEDPGSNYVMPPPEDPESNYVMPPPEDPSDGAYGYAPAAPTAATVYAWNGPAQSQHGCCCAAGDVTTTVKPMRPGLPPGAYSGFVIVRLAPGLPLDFPTLWDLARSSLSLSALQAVLELEGAGDQDALGNLEQTGVKALRLGSEKEDKPRLLESRPLVELPPLDRGQPQRAATLAAIQGLERRAAVSAFKPLHSLTAYWRVDLRPYPERAEEVVARLSALAEVELAYRELAATDPAVNASLQGASFSADQGYLDDAPAGIGAAWAWQQLAAKSTVATSTTVSSTTAPLLTVCDLEQGWNPEHKDLEEEPGKPLVVLQPVYGANRSIDDNVPWHHGTAVLCQLAAAGAGVKGAASGLGRFLLASHYKAKNVSSLPSHPFAGTTGHVAAAIVGALVKHALNPQPLAAGDVLLLEVQRGLLPTEIDAADLDAIRLASALGVAVIEAAGNGGFDLDAYIDPDTGVALRRGAPRSCDSGALLVGAARAAVPHDRAPFSNYGSRLDCFAWGEEVFTGGFGDLAGQAVTDFYTSAFSGTSSAAPIITGAAVLVQALHRAHTGSWLGPLALRALLSDPASGTRQGPNVAGPIGVMPDLKAIVRDRLQLVPDLYLRRHIGDGGTGVCAELGGSPDILLWNGLPASDSAGARFGEGPRANSAAPGTAFPHNQPEKALASKLYVRLRNRGGGAGGAKVRLFVSPAATLITPDRWVPVGSVDTPSIPQGDTLAVSPAHDWTAALLDALNLSQVGDIGSFGAALSFLAVLQPEPVAANPLGYEGAIGLPPGPPYFDWAEFRAFMKSRTVAWRNAHAIAVDLSAPTATLHLPFTLRGTPDHARHFDFEVIQRLPAKVDTTLAVDGAFAAKLRQRQPLFSAGLPLPARARLSFGGVRLPPGVAIPAAFDLVVPDTAALVRGHSLAIRQLWRGEEVGRVTWWFVDSAAQ